MPPSFTGLMFARCLDSSLITALSTPTGMMSTPSSFSTVRPWEGRAPHTVSHRALHRSSRPWRGRNGASWRGSLLVWRRSRGKRHADESSSELTKTTQLSVGLNCSFLGCFRWNMNSSRTSTASEVPPWGTSGSRKLPSAILMRLIC